MKKILALLLATLCVLSMLPVAVFAADEAATAESGWVEDKVLVEATFDECTPDEAFVALTYAESSYNDEQWAVSHSPYAKVQVANQRLNIWGNMNESEWQGSSFNIGDAAFEGDAFEVSFDFLAATSGWIEGNLVLMTPANEYLVYLYGGATNATTRILKGVPGGNFQDVVEITNDDQMHNISIWSEKDSGVFTIKLDGEVIVENYDSGFASADIFPCVLKYTDISGGCATIDNFKITSYKNTNAGGSETPDEPVVPEEPPFEWVEDATLFKQNFNLYEDDADFVPPFESNWNVTEWIPKVTTHSGGGKVQVIGGKVRILGFMNNVYMWGTGWDGDAVEVSIDILGDTETFFDGNLLVTPHSDPNNSGYVPGLFTIRSVPSEGGIGIYDAHTGNWERIATIPDDGEMHTVSAFYVKADNTLTISLDGEVVKADIKRADIPLAWGSFSLAFFDYNTATSYVTIDNFEAISYKKQLLEVPAEPVYEWVEDANLFNQNFNLYEDDADFVPPFESNWNVTEWIPKVTTHSGGGKVQVIGGKVRILGFMNNVYMWGTGWDGDAVEVSIDILGDTETFFDGNLLVTPHSDPNNSGYVPGLFTIRSVPSEGGIGIYDAHTGDWERIATIPDDGKMHTVSAFYVKADNTLTISLDGEVVKADIKRADIPLAWGSFSLAFFDYNTATSYVTIDNFKAISYKRQQVLQEGEEEIIAPDRYYKVTATAGEGGTISPAGETSVVAGYTAIFTVTPNEGYEITDVKVDGVSVGAVKQYVMQKVVGDKTIEATFNKIGEKPVEPPKEDDTLPFVDVKAEDTYYDAVKYVYENELFKGTSDTSFAPDMTMDRSMFVTVLGRMEGVDTAKYTAASKFSDVVEGEWYTPYVAWATENGIVNGYDNGTFGVTDQINIEQACAFLARYAKFKGLDTTATSDASKYADAADVSDWAVNDVMWAVNSGVYAVSDNLNPKVEAKRSLVATMVHNLALLLDLDEKPEEKPEEKPAEPEVVVDGYVKADVLFSQNFDTLENDSDMVPTTQSSYYTSNWASYNYAGCSTQVVDGQVRLNGNVYASSVSNAAALNGLTWDGDAVEISIDFLADPASFASGQLMLMNTDTPALVDVTYAYFDVENYDGGFCVLRWNDSVSDYTIAKKIPYDGKMHTVSAFIEKDKGTYSIKVDGETVLSDIASTIATLPVRALAINVQDWNPQLAATSYITIDNLIVTAYKKADA